MRRNAVAIWLKTVLLIGCIPPIFGWAPMPQVFTAAPPWQAKVTLTLIGAGCLVSLVGIFWRDRLDGGAIEQFGIVVAAVGMLMFVYTLALALPVTWFSVCVYTGLVLAFCTQWWFIYRYRRALRAESAAA